MILNPADVEALMSCKDATGEDVASMLQEKVLTIGENIQIRRFERLEGDMIAYVHGEGRIGVMVMFGYPMLLIKRALKLTEKMLQCRLQLLCLSIEQRIC